FLLPLRRGLQQLCRIVGLILHQAEGLADLLDEVILFGFGAAELVFEFLCLGAVGCGFFAELFDVVTVKAFLLACVGCVHLCVGAGLHGLCGGIRGCCEVCWGYLITVIRLGCGCVSHGGIMTPPQRCLD